MFLRKTFKGKAFEKGKLAESMAEDFLKKKGYKILCRNYRKNFGEIDIVAKKNDTLIFVEVRSLSGDFMEPSESVTAKKRGNLLMTAQAYLMENHWTGNVQFDFIGIKVNGQKTEIEHIENCFGF